MRLYLLLLVMVCSLAQAANRGYTLVEVDAANPPFMYGSINNAKGLYPAIVEMVFGMMGSPVRISAKPWKRALTDLDMGRGAVAGIYKTSERSLKYDFSQPLYVERVMVVYNRQRPVNFHSLPDLDGLQVGVLAGWSYGDAFDLARANNRFAVAEANSDMQNLAKLLAGRLDVMLVVEGSAQEPLGAAIGQGSLAMAPEPLIENQTYLAFSKKAHADALLRNFDSTLQQLKKTPIYNAIIKEHLGLSTR